MLVLRRWLAVLALIPGIALPGAPAYADDQADLGVSVTGSDSAVPGESVSWSAVVTNRGPAAARNTTLTLTVPLAGGDTLRSATSTVGPCTVTAAGTVSCDLGELAVTGSVRVSAVEDLSPDRTDPASATATVAATTPDPVTTDNSATATVAVHPEADLWLTQSAAGTNVTLGAPVTLILTLVDLGPSTLPAGTRVVETLPAAVTYAPNGSSSGCTGSGNQVTCLIGQPMQVGTRAGTTLVLQGLAMGTGALAYSAVATVPTGVTDPDPANNKASAANPVGQQADVAITTSGGTDPVPAGTTTTFTYTITNNGPGTATGVTAREVLPDGFTFDSSASGCTAVGQSITCPTIDAMPSGTSRSLAVTVRVDPGAAAGVAIRSVRVTATGADDPDGSNQTGYASVEITREANLALSAGRVGPAPVPGGTVTYELTVHNLGPATATGVTVTDRLPPEVTLGSATVPGGTCTVAGELHTCTLVGTLDPDGSQVVRVTGTLTGTTAGTTLADSGYATAVEVEPDASDNQATTSELVQAGPAVVRPQSVSAGTGGTRTGVNWLTWAGGGTVLFGLVLLALAGRRMVLTRSGR